MDLARKQQQLIARYCLIENPVERLEAVIARGRRWPAPDAAQRTAESLVRGCTSRVWLVVWVEEGRCRFLMEAEAPLVRGLAALLCELYDGEAAGEIAAFEPGLLAPLGLEAHVSPQRQHGFGEIRRTIREAAASFGLQG